MKKSVCCVVWISLLAYVPVFGALILDVDTGAPGGVGKNGGTVIAKGNSKGQTLSFAKEVRLTGIVLDVASISAAKDLSLSVFRTVGGRPAGDALFADQGTLPAKLAVGDALRIGFASPVVLAPGEYAVILETEKSDLRFRLDASGSYPAGHLIRRQAGPDWSPGAGKGNDLLFTLLGEGFEARSVASNAGKTKGGKAAGPARTIAVDRTVSHDVKALCEKLPENPNIVVCMVDDLGWNQISVAQTTMGTARKKFATPNLEKLANQGLSFTHAYAQPNCAPTRAAMLSGQYPARVNNDVYVVGNLNRNGGAGISKAKAQFRGPEQTEDVAAEAITIAEALKQNGYATAHIGKYHVGGHDGEKTLPENVGFDINIGGYTQGHQPTCFSSKRGDKWEFKGLGRGDFDRFGAPYTAAYVKAHNFPASLIGTPKHVSDALGDAMEETLKTLSSSGKPFYLQLHPYAVHGPVKARPDLKAVADGDPLAGFIASIDLNIGRLLKALEDPNGDGDTGDSIAANTLILFTSDNGGTHGDNLPLRGHKGMLTEGGVRVPLIAYWPGVIPANTITDHLVHTVDYYPTLLALTAKKWTPPESEHPLDGESFAEVFRKPDTNASRGPIFYLFPGYMDVRAQPTVVVIQEVAGKRYKLLYFYEADSWELYNLSDDIGEATNLMQTKPELAAGMSKQMHAWLTQEHATWKPKYPIVKASGMPAGPPPQL